MPRSPARLLSLRHRSGAFRAIALVALSCLLSACTDAGGPSSTDRTPADVTDGNSREPGTPGDAATRAGGATGLDGDETGEASQGSDPAAIATAERADAPGGRREAFWCARSNVDNPPLNAGQPLTFVCEDIGLVVDGLPQTREFGLFGEIQVTADGWQIDAARSDNISDVVTFSPPVAVQVTHLGLDDDALQCGWAGEGATLASEGKRLNFSCSASGREVGLFGDVTVADGIWTIDRGEITSTPNGMQVGPLEPAIIVAIGVDPDLVISQPN